jgi:hypothetical protein
MIEEFQDFSEATYKLNEKVVKDRDDPDDHHSKGTKGTILAFVKVHGKECYFVDFGDNANTFILGEALKRDI